MSNLSEKEYAKDGAFKSRKFLLTAATVGVISILGLVFGWNQWPIKYLEVIFSALITLTLGYSGINMTRVVVPRAISEVKKEGEKQGERKSKGTTTNSSEGV